MLTSLFLEHAYLFTVKILEIYNKLELSKPRYFLVKVNNLKIDMFKKYDGFFF